MPWPQLSRRPVPGSIARVLPILAVLDMVLFAWMVAAGSWFDETSRLTATITLGGRHELVMILALTAFSMLAGLALLTDEFTVANEVELALIIIACSMSIVVLAVALSAVFMLALAVAVSVVLLALAAFLLGIGLSRPRRR
jgi:hypothetical protein